MLHRNGDDIDQGLVKMVLDSLVPIGFNKADVDEECLDLYKQHFEDPFIAATDQYYRTESESCLAQDSMSDYMKKVEERLKEEEDRVEQYLNTATGPELISKCEDVLIRGHAERMSDHFPTLLDSDPDDDLQRMYTLLSRIPEGLELLEMKFGTHVKQAGLTAIMDLVSERGANIDPEAYVDALLEVHHGYSEMVTGNFKGEGTTRFMVSLDKACEEYINSNAATSASSTRSAELVVQYVDMLLRQSSKLAEGDLEGALDHVVRVSWYR